MRYPYAGLLALPIVALLVFALPHEKAKRSDTRPTTQSDQTDVQNAMHRFDKDGVAQLTIAEVGTVYHPAWVAMYALAYGGEPPYTSDHAVTPDKKKFKASVAWLETNLKQNAQGLWVWEYGFNNTYNDLTILAPWSSAFAQATGIEALVLAYRQTGEQHYLDTALKAAQVLFVPLAEGGLLFREGEDIWFEEIPVPHTNPGHILNGHMRALIALQQLADASRDKTIASWLTKGSDTLYRWLPRYDTGYWLRYDLNPRKQELLFRFAEPYGFKGTALAIESISLHDPVSKRSHTIRTASAKAFEGENRLAGVDWGVAETVDGKQVRRLIPAAITEPEAMGAPHSYAYFSLPAQWDDNLRDAWLELEVRYFDETAGHLTLQQRSIASGPNFIDMRDGDLMLNGEGVWRAWKIPLRPTDLGYPVGALYAQKHADYLSAIAAWDTRFASWKEQAVGYLRLGTHTSVQDKVSPKAMVLPKQTPMLPIYTLDKDGVVQQRQADADSRFLENGMFDPSGSEGVPTYSPYVIASQLISGHKIAGGDYSKKMNVQRAPALAWFMDPKHQVRVGDAVLYAYDFDNAYNDIATKAPWPSAFGQAYVLEALLYAEQHAMSAHLGALIRKVCAAYLIDAGDGGIRTTAADGLHFFEEVPNGTHVLNAHLISTVTLQKIAASLKDDAIHALYESGIATLRARLNAFDTGYWLRYDLNPKKEFLLQFDWYEGDRSPLIERVTLANPLTGHYVEVTPGKDGSYDMKAPARIAGTDWGNVTHSDGKTARGFLNGYGLRAASLEGGARHNAFLSLRLPDGSHDTASMPHVLTIRYKDVAPGLFGLSIQPVHEGNFLSFVPLRQGVIAATGDGTWKERTILVRPQDMGWYKGPDYQKYEVEQLHAIAALTDDWFFRQYALRHGDFLKRYEEGKPLFSRNGAAERIILAPEIVTASPTYESYGFEHALDGESNDNYVAGIENEPGFVELRFKETVVPDTLTLVWESEQNHAQQVRISHCGTVIAEANALTGGESRIAIKDAPPLRSLRIDFDHFTGQPRLLLRRLDLQSSVKPSTDPVTSACDAQ